MHLSADYLNDTLAPLDNLLSMKHKYANAGRPLTNFPVIDFVSKSLALVVAIPTTFIIKIRVRKNILRFKKSFSQINFDNLNNDDYQNIRLVLEKYKSLHDDLNHLRDMDHARQWYLTRVLLNELIYMLDSFMIVYKTMNEKFDSIYSPKATGRYFKPVKENDRWENRNKIASYQM